MRPRRLSAVALVIFLIGIRAPAMAQPSAGNPTVGRVRVGLGLTVLREDYGTGTGFEVDLQIPVSRLHVGVIADGSFNRFDGFTETALMGGVRFALPTYARLRPFGQLLAGFEYCYPCQSTDPTFEPAVGVDVALGRNGRVAIRGELGYRFTPSDGRTFRESHVMVGISVRPRRR